MSVRARLEFKPQDLWIGAFWKTVGSTTDLWICLLPCVPIHFTFRREEPTDDNES